MVTVKVARLAPARIITLVGTWATEILLLCSVSNAPPGGAAPFNDTVPVELFPPTTVVELKFSEEKLGAFTVRVALRVVPYVPEIADVVLVDVGLVVTVKVAEVLPAGTVTDSGACATDVLLLCKVTNAPPAGAATFNVTVPVELFPPTSEVGLNRSEDRVAGAVTVRVALWLPP